MGIGKTTIFCWWIGGCKPDQNNYNEIRDTLTKCYKVLTEPLWMQLAIKEWQI